MRGAGLYRSSLNTLHTIVTTPAELAQLAAKLASLECLALDTEFLRERTYRAELCGLPAQIGYADLVRRLLGQDLAKSHTRTDWSRRPLSPEQIEYALDDVRYLLPLKSQLEERLDKLNRRAWLAEELADLGDRQAIVTQPEQAWLRIKGLRGLDAGRIRLARALAAWRERRAVERNRPRGWILEDAALREIVMRVPRSAEALASIADLPPNLIRHCGEDLLECVLAADIPDPAPPVETRQRPDPAKAAL